MEVPDSRGKPKHWTSGVSYCSPLFFFTKLRQRFALGSSLLFLRGCQFKPSSSLRIMYVAHPETWEGGRGCRAAEGPCGHANCSLRSHRDAGSGAAATPRRLAPSPARTHRLSDRCPSSLLGLGARAADSQASDQAEEVGSLTSPYTVVSPFVPPVNV